MKLEFVRITMWDFKTYIGKHVVDLTGYGLGVQYLRGENYVDAIGSNGAGKTSLWDAFSWCLTGKTTRGMRGTDVRTWDGDEHARVSVSVYVDDVLRKIKRSTETNGLWLDGKQTSQDEIDRTLGLTAVNIPHTILLGQKRDLFFDLQPAKKLEILSETLNLDKWEQRSARAKTQVREIDIKMAETKGVLAQMERDLASTTADLDELRKRLASWEEERSQGTNAQEKHLKSLTKSREKAVDEMGQYDLAYDSAETELRACRHDLKRMEEKAETARDKLMKARSARATLKARYNDLRDLADSDTCPTCGQPVAAKHAHAKDAKAKLKDALETVEAAAAKETEREEKLDALKTAMTATRQAELRFGAKSDEAKDKLDHLKAHIADIDKQIAVLKAKDRSEETNPYEESVRKARQLIKNAKAGISEANELLDLMSRKQTRIAYWVNGFKLVRLYLIEELLTELTEVTQNLLPDVGLSGWAVQYDIEREKKDGSVSTGLTVRITKPGMSKAVKWEAWSGGENQRLLIVGALALSEVLLRHAGIECDLLVLDEPTRHMSREGVGDLVEYLIEAGRAKQVWYCDHAVVENARFANVVTVRKDANGSRVQ
jgi:DNA repair exonuclease SbcCD ATPase subunit